MIETSIRKVVVGVNDNDECNVTVTHLDGIPVSGRRRRLDRLLVNEAVSMLDVDFVVVSSREYFVSNCDAFALDISFPIRNSSDVGIVAL